MDQLRIEFLQKVVERYKHESPLIASNCGVSALKLKTNKDLRSKRLDKSLQALRDRVCESCGRILLMGKTKRFRVHSRIRNRSFDVKALSLMNRRGKRCKKINYSVETCLECNHRKYSDGAFTSFSHFKAQRVSKIERQRTQRSHREIAKNAKWKNQKEIDKIKADRIQSDDINDIIGNFNKIECEKKESKNTKKKKKNTKNETNRLMELTESKSSSSNVKGLSKVDNSRKRKKVPTASYIKRRF